jgi:ankyrin repeat protein
MRLPALALSVIVGVATAWAAPAPVRAADAEPTEREVLDVVNAVDKGEAKKVEAMLKKNPKLVDAKFTSGGQYNGWPLLMIASRQGHKPVVELLLKSGAKVNDTNLSSETALHYAAAHGHKAVAELLLKNKADVNVRNDGDATPLAVAQAAGKQDLVTLLKKHGAKE